MIRKKNILTSGIAIILCIGMANSQQLSRQVIGSTGTTNSNSQISSSTVGPSNLFTVSLDEVTFTQGFQQPSGGVLNVEYFITQPDCYNLFSGSIDLFITGCSGDYEIEWETGDSTSTIENLMAGYYTFEISSGSCQYMDSVLIELDTNCDGSIPNVITANSDGANDAFVIPNFSFGENQENRVSIYNRWGQLVWEGNNYDNSSVMWHGQDSNGNNLGTGTYFYVISSDGDQREGFIELLR